jgi:Concanavalin A-like lectin/glucanases superfamily
MRTIGLFIVLAALVTADGWSRETSREERQPEQAQAKLFRSGACAVSVTPSRLPVRVNGNFLEASATEVRDPIAAKCVVLDDGSSRVAIVVVDSCMMPRELLDRAKAIAHDKTGIPIESMLISATHTHSAPAAMGALGCPADERYAASLPGRIAEAIGGALKNLEPARIGWAATDDDRHTFCRRWIRRPDKMLDDPFGQRTVRANMHPGYQSADVIAPAGPVDPSLTVLAVQSKTNRPIAVLANYSMHYYGAPPVSADYFGFFAGSLEGMIGAHHLNPPFVGIMSQGTSGDQMWMDYSQRKNDPGLEVYAGYVARSAVIAYKSISFRDWVPLAMTEKVLALKRRTPDAARLAWAKGIVGQMHDRDAKSDSERAPRTLPEVYAQEALFLHEQPERELKLQAIRIGELGITAIPNEVFAITGLKIKAQSPFETTMNIELANGAEGYIPPPEQHALGGYTTWPARTAGLEVQAEPKIVATVLELLEQVAGKPRRAVRLHEGTYAKAVLASRPVAYWRLEDFEGPSALDSVTNEKNARFEDSAAFYLPGPNMGGLSSTKSLNHAVHFAGGRLRASVDHVDASYTVELWFWNGLPTDARPVTGYVLSFGSQDTGRKSGDSIGIGGAGTASGRLFFSSLSAASTVLRGKTEIAFKTWHHLALVRDRRRVSLHIDGRAEPELSGDVEPAITNQPAILWIGGRSRGDSNFEGKLDEIAVFDRALSAREIAEHAQAARSPDT